MFTIKASYLLDWYSISYLISSVLTFLILLYFGWIKGHTVAYAGRRQFDRPPLAENTEATIRFH